jgi:hypothetical protein
MIYAVAASLLLTMYAGFFVARPASPAVRAAHEVRVTTSPWTWVAMIHWIVGVLWLHAAPIVTRPTTALGRGLTLAIEALFVALMLWMARSFGREITFDGERIIVRGLLRKATAYPVAELVGIRAAPPSFIFELTLADRTKLVMYPFLQNADELTRRVILASSSGVLARIEGPAREAVAQLVAAERASEKCGTSDDVP